MNQLSIDFDPPKKHFNGSAYVPGRDDDRLRGQQLRIWNLMRDGCFRTLHQIAQSTGDPEASISAQLRHLRKPRFGAFLVDKVYLDNGLFSYRVRLPGSANDDMGGVAQ
jgi:hypothetical protein